MKTFLDFGKQYHFSQLFVLINAFNCGKLHLKFGALIGTLNPVSIFNKCSIKASG